MSFVILYSVSSTGADEGHRFAAFSIVSSGGMTRLIADRSSRTVRPATPAWAAGLTAPAHAFPGVMKGAAPPMASSRAKSRRFIVHSAQILRQAIARRQFFTREQTDVGAKRLTARRRTSGR